MTDNLLISFGDRVRVRSTPVTEEEGLAGLVGQVYGETTPSVTGVKVIGEIKEDFAVNVYFESRNEGQWFAPDMLEYMDHAAGTEIRINGVEKKWVRKETGEWIEAETKDEESRRKRWWRFW